MEFHIFKLDMDKIHVMGPNEIVVEMILLVRAVMLEEGGHTSHKCLPEL